MINLEFHNEWKTNAMTGIYNHSMIEIKISSWVSEGKKYTILKLTLFNFVLYISNLGGR